MLFITNHERYKGSSLSLKVITLTFLYSEIDCDVAIDHTFGKDERSESHVWALLVQ